MGADLIASLQEAGGGATRLVLAFFSTWGGPLGWQLATALCFWLGGSRLGLRVGFATAITACLNTLLKWSLLAPRPYYEGGVRALRASSGFGMPSGHSSGVMALWGSLAYRLRRRWVRLAGAGFVALTGLARIFEGVHSPAQVALGWALGLAVVVAVVRLEAPIVRSFLGLPEPVRLLVVIAVFAAVVALGVGVGTLWRGDFEPPATWQLHFRATVDRLGDTGAGASGLRLIDPASLLAQAGYLLGLGLCAVWSASRGHFVPSSGRHRIANVALGLPLLALFALTRQALDPAGGWASAGQGLVVALGVVQPVILGVLLPPAVGRLLGSPR